ncbi:hypothetical protein D2T29_12550 [Sinirhodobacter populi]|uniref:Uncharacterized protein n=1 Tax=Paenirhodobacter populi TaxID=2306993 RepID=A0A443KCI1_9RHOB|nr:hypothetical protein [Sinirhodobacter populi]RWR30494.1 hypothetical protein D2T29_12550 [Sinirhodobacter populi]
MTDLHRPGPMEWAQGYRATVRAVMNGQTDDLPQPDLDRAEAAGLIELCDHVFGAWRLTSLGADLMK